MIVLTTCQNNMPLPESHHICQGAPLFWDLSPPLLIFDMLRF